jgi:hypothetical protein
VLLNFVSTDILSPIALRVERLTRDPLNNARDGHRRSG